MRSKHDRLLDMAESRISLGVDLGVIHRRVEDKALDGATITLDGRTLIDFSTCSYLGLNRDPIALDTTQFQITRDLLNNPEMYWRHLARDSRAD